MPTKLNQIIAISNSKKAACQKAITEIHHKVKDATVTGLTRKYTKSADNGEDMPSEIKFVQQFSKDAMEEASIQWKTMFDVVATQDNTNCQAKGDILIDGKPLLAGVPVTHLLFLEKQLVDIHTFIDKLPVLDPQYSWTPDPNITNLYRAEEVRTQHTKKLQEPLVLYGATENHPAQTQLITRDVTVGTWTTQAMSGAIPSTIKKLWITRVLRLIDAVRYAREQANQSDVQELHVGKAIFDYILA